MCATCSSRAGGPHVQRERPDDRPGVARPAAGRPVELGPADARGQRGHLAARLAVGRVGGRARGRGAEGRLPDHDAFRRPGSSTPPRSCPGRTDGCGWCRHLSDPGSAAPARRPPHRARGAAGTPGRCPRGRAERPGRRTGYAGGGRRVTLGARGRRSRAAKRCRRMPRTSTLTPGKEAIVLATIESTPAAPEAATAVSVPMQRESGEPPVGRPLADPDRGHVGCDLRPHTDYWAFGRLPGWSASRPTRPRRRRRQDLSPATVGATRSRARPAALAATAG